MRRIPRAVGLAATVVLFVAAIWLRVTSLETLREPNGDEAWYGVQVGRLLRGEPFAWRTPNGNLVNPLHVGPQVVLQAMFGPQLWILRWPSAVAGVALIGLTYALGRRMLDRPTGLIAAGLVACLPTTIHHARMGNDCAQVTLFALLVVYAVTRGRWWLALGSYALALMAHSTSVFLMPAVAAIVAARMLGCWPDTEDRPDDDHPMPPARWKQAALPLGLMVALSGAMAWYVSRRPVVEVYYQHKGFGKHDGSAFLDGLGRVFLGVAPAEAAKAQLTAFWIVTAGLLAIGARRLVRDRRWDRLALVIGPVLSASALFVVTGSGGLQEAMRYGLFLVTPTVLAAAILAKAALIDPQGRLRTWGRAVQVAGTIALGWSCMLVYKANFLDSVGSVAAPSGSSAVRTALTLQSAPGFDAISTLGSDIPNPDRQVLRAIAGDARRRGIRPRDAIRVVAGSWWTAWPLRYLSLARPNMEVVSVEEMYAAGESGDVRAIAMMQAGAYAVAIAGSDFDRAVASAFPAEALWRREVPKHDGRGTVVIYRKADVGGLAADSARPRVMK